MQAREAADGILAEIAALAVANTPAIRDIRRRLSRTWKAQPANFIIAVARDLTHRRRAAWVGYELIRYHRAAFAQVDARLLAELAQGLAAWDTVDALAMILAGPAWARDPGLDPLFDGWSKSPNLWMRRLALASTVMLTRPGARRTMDADKILALCERLAADREDMVVKALSWALRSLAVPEPKLVQAFLGRHDAVLAARVKREVGAKLRTGLKNPRKG